MGDARQEQKSPIQVIERMVRLLQVLERHAEPLGLKQIAEHAGLHPSTAHRILSAMAADRLVDRVEPGTYRLGMRLLELGAVVKSRISVRQIALPFMKALNERTGETANLSVREEDEIVYVERTFPGGAATRVAHVIGPRAPLHLTAAGKLFLLEESPRQLHAYAERTALKGQTEHSVRSLEALERELERVRRHGFATDNEETELGVRCVAAAIRDDAGVLVAALSLSSPAERMQPQWGLLVKETAERISLAIGYRPATRLGAA